MDTEILGIVAVFIMVASYALEQRHPVFVIIFAGGCALAAFYAFLIHSYPFVVAEGIWSVVAFRRWIAVRGGT
ncbi:hypothetical protein [Nitratireductor sp. XY-223]|uniref:hypothetical protein n=1 Tax=Nitratireductor sp. XY-223 TaxID=2561926 RepID=UPI0010AB0D43|nr:hypothetical protein [Nitratireductor sp. XY-223]